MSKKLTIEQFIANSVKIHQDKYDYSLVEYINALTKVKIICKKHGMFEQTPNKHISRKQGCSKCGIDSLKENRTYNLDVIISNMNIVHNNKYKYIISNYKNTRDNITIICLIHGKFEQRVYKHLYGDGCPKCGFYSISIKAANSPTGWTKTNWFKKGEKSKYFDSFKVYIIRCWDEIEEFYKIGRTFNSLQKRFTGKYNLPYNYELIKIIEFKEFTEENAIKCYNLENELQKNNKEHKYLPNKKFNGMYECFNKLKEYA